MKNFIFCCGKRCYLEEKAVRGGISLRIMCFGGLLHIQVTRKDLSAEGEEASIAAKPPLLV